MKTTDLAMIFVAIIIPIVVVVYVDVMCLLKKEEQTLYYTNIINSAINDATYAMKNVEGEQQDVDYGYSGIAEKKITVNAKVAIDTFFNSLYDNFEIKGDMTAEGYIKNHIPAIAVVDYNGVYIYSIDNYSDSETDEKHIDYVLKPKRYFTYSYAIDSANDKVVEVEDITSEDDVITVMFTMDDYIMYIDKDGVTKGFYLEDDINNSMLYNDDVAMKEKVIQHLRVKRSQVISNIVASEMSFAVSNHNMYSSVDYEFTFPAIALSQWEEMVDNVGIVAFLQGINVGNTKLDYVAHGISGLKVTDRYFVSKVTTGVSALDYYHSTKDCKKYKSSTKEYMGYYMNKLDASTAGYYPCPVCKP